MLPSISPPAENDFRNKAGKWNLYSMSSLNNLSLKLQNTLYSRIGLIQTGKKSRSHNSLKNLWSGMPVWSWLKTEKMNNRWQTWKKRKTLLINIFYYFPSVLSAQILQQRGSTVVLKAATTIFTHASDHEQCRAVACILLKAVPFTAPIHDKDPACFKLRVTSATRGLHLMWYSPLDLRNHRSKQLNKEKKTNILKHSCNNWKFP